MTKLQLLVKTDSFNNHEIISKIVSTQGKHIILLQMSNGILKITNESTEITWIPITFPKISQEYNSLLILSQQVWFVFRQYLFNKKYESITMEGYPFALIACLAKILKLTEIDYITYMCGDWLKDSGTRKSNLISYIGNQIFYPLSERFIANNCDLIINLHQDIIKQREKLIGKKIKAKQLVIIPTIPNRNPIFKKHSNKILYLGKLRSDSGLIEFLHSLEAKGHFKTFQLNIIGPKTTGLIEVQKKYNHLFETNQIKYLGFIDREKYSEILPDYFCGLNLITSTDNYSTYTIQAKIVDYISYCIPVLTSINVNESSLKLISENKLGLVTSINTETIINCVEDLFNNQVFYYSNIRKFFENNSK
jgi:hypothetical protein